MSNFNSEYVSCIRIKGVPILPPVLTEEDRRKCQIYRQQAIDIEKRLQEKKLRERIHLETVEEETSQDFDITDDGSSSSEALEVMDFIRRALGDSNDLEEVKFLISQVGEELQKRRSAASRDSTFNDVESLSLNQNTSFSCNQNIDPYNLDVENSYFDRESGDESIIHVDDHTEYEKPDTEPLVSEASDFDKIVPEHSDNALFETEQPNTVGLVSNFTSNQFLQEESEDLITEISKNELVLDAHRDSISSSKSNESEVITPTKSIRRNSYTLESPSPSVLVYLRSLTLGNPNEKSESSSKVVKNLNNYWEDEVSIQNMPIETLSPSYNVNDNTERCSPGNKHDRFDIDVDNGIEEIKSPDNEEEIGAQEYENENKMKAATIIQAAGRGFLVRRLMKTEKIKDLKVIIKEAVLCAWSLYGEQAVSPADLQLHERIIQQVTAACYELHCIFFNWSTADRMALIRTDREKMKNPKRKFRASRDRKISDSDSISSSTRSKSASSVSGMSRSSTQRERPTTLPSNPRTNFMYQHWSR